ncbi:NAD-binding protein [Streptomyces sp. YGL11-2]|uniref:NAD-binding protein n=1 Tax=Streptomyces sp. YGL11-2 TaxID=3414028 RepID=UPI003CEC28A1
MARTGPGAAAAASVPPPAAPRTDAEPPPEPIRILEAAQADDAVLAEAGIAEAGALALVQDDDELNIHAALRTRRLNPRLRLVIRLYHRKLGQHLEELLDQAAAVAASRGAGGEEPPRADGSTTVLAVDTSTPDNPEPDTAAGAPQPGAERAPALLAQELGDGYVLRPQDRVLLAATREGLGDLLSRHPRTAGAAGE